MGPEGHLLYTFIHYSLLVGYDVIWMTYPYFINPLNGS